MILEDKSVEMGDVLWTPRHPERTNMANFQAWVENRLNRKFDEYADLWNWSIEEIEEFWSSICEYFDVHFHRPAERVLVEEHMPGAQWFPGARLNYAEQVFRHVETRANEPAIIYEDETGVQSILSWRQFGEQTRRAAFALKAMGIGEGDRVAAYAPHSVEMVIAFQACASIGAVWTCSSPDFGMATVVDRFAQIEPQLLIAKPEYSYGGKRYDRSAELAELIRAMPSIENVLLLPSEVESLESPVPIHHWLEALEAQAARTQPLDFTSVPFDHPLWVLYSSGTTGKPKAIVHGHGGVLLEHLKSHALHFDLGPKDKFFWFTTTGWVMWNVLVGGLLVGSTIVIFDGNPAYPDERVLWRMAERLEITFFGAGAAFLMACMNTGLKPGEEYDLSSLHSIGSTGSPLSVEAFAWCYNRVKQDVCVASASGGTDIAGGFIGGVPTRPVKAGQLQGRMLGASIFAFDAFGSPVTGQIGELVVTRPMPSMPLYFWNDPEGLKYRESYFDKYPGIWRHGDFLEVRTDDQCIIHGRSDATLNRYGIRIGTAEIYRIVESLSGISDSLIVNLEYNNGTYKMPLFIVLETGTDLTEELKTSIASAIRKNSSPRHVPDSIIEVSSIPYTITGKKMEVPVKRILAGECSDDVVNIGSIRNPESLKFFESIAHMYVLT